MVNNETNHQEMMLNGNYNVTEDNLEIVEDIEESIRNESDDSYDDSGYDLHILYVHNK